MIGTQYLQVPKPLPYRRSRSRSKTRLRDVVPEAVPCSVLGRPRSPPICSVESPSCHVRPTTPPIIHDAVMMRRSSPSRRKNLNKLPEVGPIDLSYNNDIHVASLDKLPSVQIEAIPPSPIEDMYTLDQCRTPPPELPLRQRLIGTWKLESYIAYPTTQSPIQRPTFPMTKNVTGFIMYTPDGFMCAQMLIPGQKSFKRGEGEEPQWAEAGKRSFSYGGPFYITNEGPGTEEVLRHTFQVCNLPGWIGDVQIRTHRFEDDGQVLVLGSENPTQIKGDQRIPVLKWRRARDNAQGVPPPPLPQIRISGPGEP